MNGCATCGGFGYKHDPVAHWGPSEDVNRCWAMADDEDPDCPIGSARCVRSDGHEDDHIWEAAQ